MKRLRLRVSNFLKVSVLALIFSVFLQASLASAIDIDSQADLEAIGVAVDGETPSPLDGHYVVTNSFIVGATIGDTYVIDTFTGTFNGGGYTISGLTKPLFDDIGEAANVDDIDTVEVKDLNLTAATGESGGITGAGALANLLAVGGTIDNVSSAGDVTGTNDVGGLVGYSYGAITNSSATGVVTGNSYVGGLVGSQEESSTITNSNAKGAVYGYYAVGGLVGRSRSEITNSYANSAVDGAVAVGGLVGESTLTSTITNSSYATGDVIGSGEYIGGLVGYLAGAIDNSYATGDVTGTGTYDGNLWDGGFDEGDLGIGGLVGYSSGYISDSYAEGNVNGFKQVGGLVGSTGTGGSVITDSYATGTVTGSGDDVGGLVGLLDLGYTIINSYAAGTVEGTNDVGGLVGYSKGTITNSYATGAVTGTGENGEDLDYSDVGGLVGESISTITNSYATGNVTGQVALYTGRLYGYSDVDIDEEDSYGTGSVNNAPYLGESAPEILSIVNTWLGGDFVPAFEVNASINGGLPYLISLIESYDVAETPSYSLRSYYTQAARSLDKALTSFGFKSNFSSHPNLGFQALEQNQSKLPAVIQLFEVSEYQNSNILLNKADGLQLSISSYYKESVEIWTQGLNGEYLYLGLVEFDKDGKAILPALKFDTANTYQLLMIKAADKLSEKPNLEAQLGQININVF